MPLLCELPCFCQGLDRRPNCVCLTPIFGFIDLAVSSLLRSSCGLILGNASTAAQMRLKPLLIITDFIDDTSLPPRFEARKRRVEI